MERAARATCLVSNGPVDDPRTYSGTPYFFWKTASAQGLDVRPTDCAAFGTAPRRWLWALRDRAAGRIPGGFLSKALTRVPALALAWRPLLPLCRGHRVLNFHPLYPAAARQDPSIERWAYIDQTLTQLGDYQPDFDPDHPMFAPVLAEERASYAACAGVIAMTERARRSLVDAYGVPPEKITVVRPGANLPPADITAARRAPRENRGGVRLVFVGLDWRRKGLTLLIDAAERLRALGMRIDVAVLGPRWRELPAAWRGFSWLEVHGRIGKMPDAAPLCRLIAAADLGVLLPDAEAASIAIREYQALGLPVLVRDRGGAAEMVGDGAGRILPGDVTADTVAAAIRDMVRPEVLAAHRAAVDRQRNDFLWDGTVRAIFDRMDSALPVGGQ